MAYSDFKSYASSIQVDIKLGLDRMYVLLDYLKNPQDDLKFIHVAGTNGKGSVCAFLQSMLTHAGYKTGKFTSPDMVKINERMNIDGTDISDEEMEKLFDRVEEACRQISDKVDRHPTQFEFWTAAAFLYFKEQKCDVVVLEVGMGGRLDATNVIKKPICSVITRVALDHTLYLGDTVDKVAFEKCGIIKEGAPTVTTEQYPEALAVIKDVCKNRGSKLYVCPTAPSVDKEKIYEKYGDVFLSLGGTNQLENCPLAVKAAEIAGIGADDIKYGLTHAKHTGRFELIEDDFIYDGAHNPNGIEALIKNLERYYPDRKKTFIMAAMSDKDISTSLEMLKGEISNLYTVCVKDNPRALSAEAFRDKAKELGINAECCASVTEAYKKAKVENNLTIMCGSLYLYKDFFEEVLSNER